MAPARPLLSYNDLVGRNWRWMATGWVLYMAALVLHYLLGPVPPVLVAYVASGAVFGWGAVRVPILARRIRRDPRNDQTDLGLYPKKVWKALLASQYSRTHTTDELLAALAQLDLWPGRYGTAARRIRNELESRVLRRAGRGA